MLSCRFCQRTTAKKKHFRAFWWKTSHQHWNTHSGPEDQQYFPKYVCHSICVTDIIIKHHYSGKWVILQEIKAFCRGILFTGGVSISYNEILTADWRIYNWEWESHSIWDYKRVHQSDRRCDIAFFPWLDVPCKKTSMWF